MRVANRCHRGSGSIQLEDLSASIKRWGPPFDTKLERQRDERAGFWENFIPAAAVEIRPAMFFIHALGCEHEAGPVARVEAHVAVSGGRVRLGFDLKGWSAGRGRGPVKIHFAIDER